MSGRNVEINEISLGNYGSVEITDTTKTDAPSGDYFTAIQVVEDAVFSAATDYNVSNADLTAFTIIFAGSIIYGKWSSLTLSAGQVIAYYG